MKRFQFSTAMEPAQLEREFVTLMTGSSPFWKRFVSGRYHYLAGRYTWKRSEPSGTDITCEFLLVDSGRDNAVDRKLGNMQGSAIGLILERQGEKTVAYLEATSYRTNYAGLATRFTDDLKAYAKEYRSRLRALDSTVTMKKVR